MVAILNASTNKENEMNAFQEFCKEIQCAVIAAANGEVIQYQDNDGKWLDKPSYGFIPSRKYRVKPKTINIAGIEVPAPEVNPLMQRERYFIPNTALARGYDDRYWINAPRDVRVLNHGLVHKTKEAAIAHTEALLSITSK